MKKKEHKSKGHERTSKRREAKAQSLLGKRKEILRRAQALNPDHDEELIQMLYGEADKILKQVRKLGGVSKDSAFGVALTR